jgi:polyisoprenoid-binding protein YceI
MRINGQGSSISVLIAAVIWLGACSEPVVPPAGPTTSEPPVAQLPQQAPFTIDAPAGRYEVDPYHANLSFSVRHLGLSNYIARFTRYSVSIEFDPQDLAASTVAVSIDPASVRTDFSGDYIATHPDSKFQSWDQDLAQSDKFFASGQYPEITFRSTGVEPLGGGQFRIIGDLTLRGQTHPVALEATLVGAVASHPMNQNVGALGFSARGSFNRSNFGMDYLVQPPLLGDEVVMMFEGEFQQVVP